MECYLAPSLTVTKMNRTLELGPSDAISEVDASQTWIIGRRY